MIPGCPIPAPGASLTSEHGLPLVVGASTAAPGRKLEIKTHLWGRQGRGVRFRAPGDKGAGRGVSKGEEKDTGSSMSPGVRPLFWGFQFTQEVYSPQPQE